MEAILLKEVAEILNIPERDIERESLKTFLEAKLKKLLIEQLQLTRKYGVKNVDEMENFYIEQKLSEKESFIIKLATVGKLENLFQSYNQAL